ncbi:MAG: hypothetical protein ABW043_21410 [Devosia sp.]|uniref:DUF6894 family protein n=1 Tax=Devosia sp. TaxID=1871048 RepID=UPI003397214A
MPRYFFHYRTDEELVRDEAGSELADLEAAEQQAAEIGKAIIDKLAGEGGETRAPRTIEITDARGEELLYVVFWEGPKIGEGSASPVTPVSVH